MGLAALILALTALFAWSLCRAAGAADRQIEALERERNRPHTSS